MSAWWMWTVVASAASPSASVTWDKGWVGPFALHPDGTTLAAVVEQQDGCSPKESGAKAFSSLHLYALPDLSKPSRTVTLPSGCTESIFWSPAKKQVVVRKAAKGGSKVLVVDATSGEVVKDLGSRAWGSLQVTPDGKLLSEIVEKDEGGGAFTYTTTMWRTEDWARDGVTNIHVEHAAYPPAIIANGTGLLHLEGGYLWQYDLLQGSLVTSRPAPPDRPEDVLKLIDGAAPGGESEIYVANDFQSGFDRPLPKLWDKALPKHVFSVPTLDVVCKVEGGGIEKLRDFQKAYVGSRHSPHPSRPLSPVYQRSLPGGRLVVFLMPPEDPFVNPFGRGQVALAVTRNGASCAVSEVASLGQDPFWFDAAGKWLVVTQDKHRADTAYRGLALYPLP